jgi:DNA-binding MarR family transcriptional regulator
MIKPDIKARFVASMLRFVTAVKTEAEFCTELCGGFNEKELLILLFVGENKSVKMSDIADNLKAPLSTLTSIVDKLVEKQYLARVHSDEDRRVVNVTLMNKGKNAFKIVQKRKEEVAEKVLSEFTAGEQTAFMDYLDKMSAVIESIT